MQNNLYRNLLEQSSDYILIVNAQGIIDLVSVGLEKVTGYTHKELIGQPVEILIPERFQNHIQLRDNYIAKPKARQMGTGRELVARRKDGSEFPIEISLNSLKTEQGLIVSAIIIDITEHKKAIEVSREEEQQLIRAVIDVPTDMIYVKDIDDRFILVNPTLANYFGRTVAEIIGKTNAGLFPTEERARQSEIEDREILSTGKSFNYERTEEIKGSIRTRITTKSPYRNAEGKIIGVIGISRDITERKQAEEALRESEERLLEAQRMAHMGSWELDISTNIVHWSDEVYRIYGLSRDDEPILTRERIMEALHPNDQDRIYQNIDHTVESGEGNDNEYRIVRPDGSVRTVRSRREVKLDNDGNIVGLAGIVHDITERKQAEDALQQYKHIIDSTSDMMAFIDANYVYQAVNQKYLDAYQKTHDEVIGHHFIDAIGKDYFKSFAQENINRCIAGESFNHQVWRDYPNLGERCMDINYSPYKDSEGDITGAVLSIRDITERKQAEEELRQSEERFDLAVKGSNDGLWDWDIENDKTWWSLHYCKFLGYEDGEIEAGYQNFLDLLHPEDKDKTLAAIQSHLEQRTVYDMEHRLQTKSGEYRWFRSRGQAIWDEQGKTTRMSGSTQDITERKQAEAELEKHRHHLEELVDERTVNLNAARIEAEQANIAKSEFLSRMSHELRTPMNAILGFGQLLEFDAEDFTETQRDNVQEILEAGYHLLNLINDVLDLAKIESGKMDVTVEEVHVNDVLQQCITLISKQAAERQVELINHIGDKGYAVQADFTRLKQVLLNLLTNAVKYNREQGRITLDSEIIDQQRLRISVTDTGKGLTKANIAKLFRPFERLNMVNNVEGTGIGLVICKHLIELMGGTIGVNSTPGEGSTFWVELALFNDV